MAHILFILGQFYPRSSANGVCCYNVINECVSSGHNVTCIVNNDSSFDDGFFKGKIKVVRIRPKFFSWVSDWVYYHPNNVLKSFFLFFARLINTFQLLISTPVWPLSSISYTGRFLKKALNEKDIDVVVGVYTPFEALYAAYKYKKKNPNVKFVPYYLDALYGGWGPNKLPRKIAVHNTSKWENKINSLADYVISMESSREYHNFCPLESDKSNNRIYLDVPTFLSSKIACSQASTTGRVTCVYAGSIFYPARDPFPFLKSFVTITKDLPIYLKLIGPTNIANELRNFEMQSQSKISYLGTLSHEEVLNEELNADFLLNLGSSNPNTIPCKIFEYIQINKPIISTFNINAEPSIPYLNKFDKIFFFDDYQYNEEKQLFELTQFLLRDFSSFPQIDFSTIFYKNTPKAFVDFINTIL